MNCPLVFATLHLLRPMSYHFTENARRIDMRIGSCFVGIACMAIGCADEGYHGEVFYSVVDNGSAVELTWSSFEGADYYEIRLNGNYEADTADTSYKVITPCKTIELYADYIDIAPEPDGLLLGFPPQLGTKGRSGGDILA